MKTILISNRKGGSGKSTTAVMLARILAAHHSVLLIDLDTQGHATLGSGVAQGDAGVHAIFEATPLCATLATTATPNLTLSPASAYFDPYTSTASERLLQERLADEGLEEAFTYCIIDTAPTFDLLLKNALGAADFVVIPALMHTLGVVAVDQMFKAIYRTALQLGRGVPQVGILPTMYNPHIPEHIQSLRELERRFGKEKLFDPICHDIGITTLFAPKSPPPPRLRAAADYARFATALQSRLEEAV